ncbi:MAG: DUF4118 domain-containing protein [Verrucomicrobia bacterium]|nr:DUF4118 domain-containing protein [Verrucomicrobiota bacterium]
MAGRPNWIYLTAPAAATATGWKRWCVSYGVAVALIGGATVLRLPFAQVLGVQSPFLLYYPAAVAAAWFGGIWAGLVATGLGAAAADYFWIPPQMAFAMSSSDGLRLALFAMASGTAAILIECLHRAIRGERDAKEQLRLALAGARDAIVVADARGRIVFLNAKAQLLSGWSIEEVAGKAFGGVFFILDRESRQPINNAIQRAAIEGRCRQLPKQVTLVSKAGAVHHLEHKASRIMAHDGSALGTVILLHDHE